MGSTHGLPGGARIEICGGIASGKTTLALILDHIGISSILENFQENPFWKAFYADPLGTAFETEISFLLQHYHEIKSAAKKQRTIVCDFSLVLDLAYAHVTLDDRKRTAFGAVYREICNELAGPDLVIHLLCDPHVELERIRRRGREVEKSVTVDYLAAVNQALVRVLREEAQWWDVLTIDSVALDFANNDSDQRKVVESVGSRMVGTTTPFSK